MALMIGSYPVHRQRFPERDGLPDILLRGMGILVQQLGGGQHHPRGAETALEGIMLHKCFLDRSGSVSGQPFHSGDLAAIRLNGQNETAPDRLSVQQDRA